MPSPALVRGGIAKIAGLGRSLIHAIICYCCGPVEDKRYWRWCPCDEPGCHADHLDFWISEGEPLNDCAGVLWDGDWCYYKTGYSLLFSQLPPGARTVPGDINPGVFECLEGVTCADSPCYVEGPCPCGCESVCLFVRHGPPRPGHPEDPPCEVCCWGRPMEFGLFERRTIDKVLVPNTAEGYSTCPGTLESIGVCPHVETLHRSAAPITPPFGSSCPGYQFDRSGIVNPYCTTFPVGVGGPDGCYTSLGIPIECCHCYEMETRNINPVGSAPGCLVDTGWVSAGAASFTPIVLDPFDTGWILVQENWQPPLDQPGPHYRFYSEVRCRVESTCAGWTGYQEIHTHSLFSSDPGGNGHVECALDEVEVYKITMNQGPTGGACCAGCRQSICDDVTSGGPCYPVSAPVGPPDEGGGGPITPTDFRRLL